MHGDRYIHMKVTKLVLVCVNDLFKVICALLFLV